jgi:hypothetical protein
MREGINFEPANFEAVTVGMSAGGGIVQIDDVLHITTHKGRYLQNARVTRIDNWSPYPFKVEYMEGGILRRDALNLYQCSWCHAGGVLSSSVH